MDRAAMKCTGPIDSSRSVFTYRHFRQMSNCSTATPLRAIALVDFDAFYAQCETVRLGLPTSQPLAVKQWNAVIAVNYPAREFGVRRGAAVADVIRLCPDIALPHVATWREGHPTWSYRSDAKERMAEDKAALDPYRAQSRRALEVIRSALPITPAYQIERASVDEFYIDLSAQIHSTILDRYADVLEISGDLDDALPAPPGYTLDWHVDDILNQAEDHEQKDKRHDWDDVVLSLLADAVRRIRTAIYLQMQFTCSAGISHNKVLAKIGAGLRKPNGQTVIRHRDIQSVLYGKPISCIRGLGGKLGAQLANTFGSTTIKDLQQVPLDSLQSVLGCQSAIWVYNVVRGQEQSVVASRTDVQSMLSAKTFTPPIRGKSQAIKWLRIFTQDMLNRVQDLNAESQQQRRPTVLRLHHHIHGRFGPSRSRQTIISTTTRIDLRTILGLATNLLDELTLSTRHSWPCQSLSLSMHKFVSHPLSTRQIDSFMVPRLNASKEKSLRHDQPSDNSTRFTSHYQDTQPSTGRFEMTKIRVKAFDRRQETPEWAAEQTTTKDDYECPLCSSTIPANFVLEHLDWHVAVDLERNGGS